MNENGISTELISNIFECLWCKISTTANSVFYFTTIYYPPDDITCMTLEWKKAVRDKRKYAIQFAKDRSCQHFDLMRKYKNIVIRERRKAIKACWYNKSDELKSRPREFYKTFKPFISKKTKDSSNSMCLRTGNGELEEELTKVVEMLGDYFSTVANNIGGDHVNSLREDN